MKRIFIIIITLIAFASLVSAQMKLEIRLISSKKLIECEPIWMSIVWENASQQELKIGIPIQPASSEAISLLINSENKKIPLHGGDFKLYAPSTLKPGERIEDKINLRMFDLANGYYKVKAIADFSNFPPGYFHGIVESNIIEFSIEAPHGIDLQAYQAAEKLPADNFDKKMTKKDIVCSYLSDKNFVLSAYPTSIYAGWILWHGIYHTWIEVEEKSVHSPENVVLIVLGKMPFEYKKNRKNLQTASCSWIRNRNQALMEKLAYSLKEGEPRDSIAECLAEEYFDHKKYEEAIKLFKMSANHYRAKGFIDAIRKYMPEYSGLFKE